MANPTITIQTTQNVAIDYDLAGLGHRIGACLIDLILVVFTWWLLLLIGIGLIGDDVSESFIFLMGPIFFILIYYFSLETFNQGQTIGKKLLGIRVVRIDGRDPTPADFLTRTVFFLIDVLFTLGAAATLMVATSRDKQRLGDLVAGTAVILTNPRSVFSLQDIMGIKNREDYEPVFPGVQRFTDADMMVVKQSLDRLRKYGGEAHRRAVRELTNSIAEGLGLEVGAVNMTPEKFLETVLLDYIVVTR